MLLCRNSGFYLHTVVVGALAVEVAAVVVDAAVIQWTEAHEAMLQGVVPFLVHVVVSYNILFTRESLSTATHSNRLLRSGDSGGSGVCVHVHGIRAHAYCTVANQQHVMLSIRQQLHSTGANWQPNERGDACAQCRRSHTGISRAS